MRKMIGVLLIAVVIGGFVWMTIGKGNNRGDIETSGGGSNKSTYNQTPLERIESIKEVLVKSYPTEPKEIISEHNELMGICYRYPMDEEAIKSYVETIRNLYSEEFKALNSEENQIAALREERKTMSEKEMELLTSKIIEVYVAQDTNGEDVSAEVNVIHATNLGSGEFVYRLIKEEGLWKISGWEIKQQENEQ